MVANPENMFSHNECLRLKLFCFKNLTVSGLVPSLVSNFLASGDFCCLLITFANSLDPDQDRQDVGPDLDPNCLTL